MSRKPLRRLAGESLWRRFSAEIGVIILLCVFGIFVGVFVNSRHLIDNAVLERARAHFQAIVLTRKWNAQYGGVFVEKRPGVESNPYLTNPDIRTADGTVYTRKNPALMTREISEIAAREGAYRYHITSLKPINPANVADGFEREALLSFEKGKKEATETIEENGGSVFRYMAPLRVEESCLQCHAAQGYKVGDIRGGISVSFDISNIEAGIVRSGLITAAAFAMAITLILALVFRSVARLQRWLRESNMRWQFALEGAGDGVWDWDLESGKIHYSRQWKAMLGFAENEIGDGLDEWEKRVHPDDFGRCRENLDRHLRGETPVYACEIRLLCKDGSYKWILARGKVVARTNDGRPVRAIGTHADISGQKKIEEGLRESEGKFREVLEHVPLIGISLDPRGRLTFANDHFLGLTGWSASEVLGRDWFETFIPPAIAGEVGRVFRETMDKRNIGPFTRFENEILTRDGKLVLVAWFNVLTRDGKGEIIEVTCLGLDITERVRAEKSLRESEDRFAKAFFASPAAKAIARIEDGLLYDVNRAWLAMLGYKRDDVIGKTVDEIGLWVNIGQRSVFIDRLVREGSVREFEATFRTKHGEERTMILAGEIIELSGQPQLLIAFYDVTERKKAELALRESEGRFATTFFASPSANAITRTADGVLLDVNPAWLSVFGYSREEVVGRKVPELRLWKEASQRLAFVEQMERDGTVRGFEATILTKTGEERTIAMAGQIVDLYGTRCILSAFQDITERKRAEEALREGEERFKAFLDHSPEAVHLKDAEGRYLFVNRSFSARHGKELHEIKGKTAYDIVPAGMADVWVAGDREVLATRRAHQYEATEDFADGTRHTTLTTKFPVFGGKGSVVGTGGVSLDITERKRAEDDLRRSEERRRYIIQSAMDGFWVTDMQGHLREVNAAYCRMSGYEEAELLTMSIPDLEANEAAADVEARIREIADKGELRFESRHRRKDGTLFDVEVSVQHHPVNGGRMVAFLRDVTEHNSLERQLMHAQKMEVVGQLAGGTAHDFNNLLQVIQSNLELTGHKVTGDEKAERYMEAALNAVQRGADLSRQLLSFARQQTLKPAVVDPNELVKGAARMLRRTLGEDIELKTDLYEEIPGIYVDTNGLENALLNLAINARGAMPKGGTLTLRTGPRNLDRDMMIEESILPAGDYVEISVADTGSGMAPEVLARAFEPFFTTKAAGEGSGLGLSMVYGFTLQSGGHVSLESEEGKGTTVRMMFPAAAAPEKASRKAGRRKAVEKGKGTILVVEDDPDVRLGVVRLLDTLGYRTLEAENGPDALDILEREPGVDLLFADVVIPGGMSGAELAVEAARRHGRLKVLLTSGYPQKALEKGGVSERRFQLIRKPYSTADLGKAVKATLAR